jgi:hypothetical protein
MGSAVIDSFSSALYQLAFVTPGISPASASCRKQIRHKENLRKNPRGRPQRLQRFRRRVLNLTGVPAFLPAAISASFFSSLAIFAVVAMNILSRAQRAPNALCACLLPLRFSQ